MMDDSVLLKAENIRKHYPIYGGFFRKVIGHVKAVDGVSFELRRGETLGIVGESGCGKTTLGRCLLRLQPLTQGSVHYKLDGKDVDLTRLDKANSFRMRRHMQIVFQDPYSALNPTKDIFDSFNEPMKIHGIGANNREREEVVAALFEKVNLSPDYMFRYPHEFSGGQRQRICIARALSVRPELLLLDEPVSALDVSIQAQVLNLLKDIQEESGLTFIFIAHDLSVVQYMSDRIAVMYLGKIVELASSEQLYENPIHPYTQALLSAVPIPRLDARAKRIVLEGDVPSPAKPPSGCAFHPRCRYCMDICKKEKPELLPDEKGHFAACHLMHNIKSSVSDSELVLPVGN